MHGEQSDGRELQAEGVYSDLAYHQNTKATPVSLWKKLGNLCFSLPSDSDYLGKPHTDTGNHCLRT